MKQLPINITNKIYFTSDSHAFHKNIVRGTTTWDVNSTKNFKVRDFDTPEEMNLNMAEKFNNCLPSDAILYHLGDFSFDGIDKVKTFREMLNVKELHIITGNHDHHIESGVFNSLFTSNQKYLELEIGKKIKIALFHFPIMSWNNLSKGSYHLHGHQHWTSEMRFGNGRMMDVGVDGNDLMPYSFDEIISLLENRERIDPNGHHVTKF